MFPVSVVYLVDLCQINVNSIPGKNKWQTTNLYQYRILLIWHLRVQIQGDASLSERPLTPGAHMCIAGVCVEFQCTEFQCKSVSHKDRQLTAMTERNNRCCLSIRQTPPAVDSVTIALCTKQGCQTTRFKLISIHFCCFSFFN